LAIVAIGLWKAVDAALANMRQIEHGLDAQIKQVIESTSTANDDPQSTDQAKLQHDQLQRIRDSLWSVHWPALAIACLCGMLGIVPPACYWFSILRSINIHVPAPVVARAYFLGNLGKYVPGKAMVLVLRATALRPYGASIKLTTASVVVETLTTMASGAAIGGLIVQLIDTPLWLRVFGLLTALCCFAPIMPIIFRPVLTYRLAPGDSLRQVLNEKYNLRLMAVGVGLSLINWLLLGTSLFCVIQSLPFAALSSDPVAASLLQTGPALPPTALPTLMHTDNVAVFWLICVAACALSVVAGFVSLLPGGAGVRELVLTVLLTPLVGSAGALVVAIVHRLVTIVSEVLMAFIGSLMQWQYAKRSKSIDATPAVTSSS
jgi:uncharacterized membrane protein YbhN (UPF0104 family)